MLINNTKDWHKAEKEWWNKYGEYMAYQWSLTPYMNKTLRVGLQKNFMEYLKKSEGTLLDLGCGNGWLSIQFANQNMKVFGLDISKTQIDVANECKNKMGLTNITFECADFLNWDIEKYFNKFDCIFVNAFLHHLPEIEVEMLFTNINKVLKKGGHVFMYEPLKCENVKPNIFVKKIDRIIIAILNYLINVIPIHYNLFNDVHKKMMNGGYTMSSPKEAPVDLELLRRFSAKNFEIIEIKGWHLYSLGFAMQTMGLKSFAKKVYSQIAIILYLIDVSLIRLFSWQVFSDSHRFILCSIKLRKI